MTRTAGCSAHRTYHFELSVPKAHELILSDNGRRTTVRAASGGKFQFDYAPQGVGKLTVSERPAGSYTYRGVLQYDIVQ